MNSDTYNVPQHTIEALDRYWEHGYSPGSFLGTLLAGDVFAAIGRADHFNKEALGHIVYYILHKAPIGSYGSYEVVQDWINQGQYFQDYQKRRVVEYLSTP